MLAPIEPILMKLTILCNARRRAILHQSVSSILVPFVLHDLQHDKSATVQLCDRAGDLLPVFLGLSELELLVEK